MAEQRSVRLLCRLRGKAAGVYKDPNTITVEKHVTDKEDFVATEKAESNGKIRYYINRFDGWVDSSQLFIIEELVEAESDSKSSNNEIKYKLIFSNDVLLYQISGSTMNLVSDYNFKIPSGSTESSTDSFMQHRGGKIEVFYKIVGGSFDGYWVKADSSVSVVKVESEEKSEQTKPKIKRIAISKNSSNSDVSPLTDDTTTNDDGDDTDDDVGEEGVTIGAFYEEPQSDDSEEVVEYDSFADYIADNITGAAQIAWNNSSIGSMVNSVVNAYRESQAAVYSGYSLMSIPIYRYNYVHGMPFQFTPLTDRRYYSDTIDTDGADSSDMYGRLFAQTIVADTPIAVFTPGLPRYLTSATTGIQASTSQQRSLLSLLNDQDDADLQTLLNSDKNLEYFSLGVTLTEYFKYVNALTRNSARLMGIGQTTLYNSPCENLDWGNYNKEIDSTSVLSDILGIDGGVSFAFDPQSGISHTLANSTTASSIASQLNTYSAQARELEFIAGASTAATQLNPVKETISGILSGVGGDDSGNNIFSRLATGINNVVQGLNIKFPEIWSDSEQQQSYSCEMKFVSPYASEFCCWRYVLVPFFHLLPLAAPRATKSLNSYTSPFLIRAYSKGYFNVEMGIIDTLTYKRFGDGDMITGDGVPSQIDVEVSFHDLYKQLTVATAGGTNVVLFFNNTGLIDLLGTLSGVNMNRLSIPDRLSLFFLNEYNWATGIVGNFRRKITDHFNTFLHKFSPSA